MVKEDCTAAIKLDPHNIKAYFRMARAHHALGQLEEALEVLQRGLTVRLHRACHPLA